MSRAFFGLACIFAWAFIQPAHAADLTAIADTNTDSASPTTNYGSKGIIAVSSARIGLIRFDAAQVAQVNGSSAALKLQVLLTKNSSNAIAIRLVTSAWNEKTVTAKTLPTLAGGALDQKTITSTDQGKAVTFNVSAALAAWKANPATNFGLAIVAASPAPNLHLGSREGGAPAVLSSGGPAADNDVTVSASGGDYADPISAAKNALQGDRWCLAPTASRPCVIHVSAGQYVMHETLVLPDGVLLVGEEKGEALLYSDAQDVAVIAQSSAVTSAITDLSIIAKNKGLRFTGSGLNLESMILRAGDDAVHISGGPAISITDTELATVSQAGGTALSRDQGSGNITVTRSHIIVVGRGAEAVAMGMKVQGSSSPTRVLLQDSTFSIHAGEIADGYQATNGPPQSTEVIRTNFNVSSDGLAFGLSGEGVADLTVLDSRIMVHVNDDPYHEQGHGLAWHNGHVLLDGVVLDTSSVAAILIGPDSGPAMSFTALRSQLSAGQSGFNTTAAQVTLESSALIAPQGALLNRHSAFKATKSQVVGALVEAQPADPSTATCNQVYDGNLQLRPTNCIVPR